ncbi:zinc transporter ZIP3-like isoform X2 [Clytia hemisphaerica]|uniref:Uncharacterized protein n=1 Tax=Clytia hemisphaerica TaxID=252671 RepID=A0A7M5V0U3_9CNID
MDWTLFSKIIGAILLFVFTFLFTILPYKLKKIRQNKLKSISCFCGGLFLGLSFLHLIPETLHGIHDNESLMKIQKVYPFGELVVILGMILVLATEKFAGMIQINRKTTKVKCDASENCCQEECTIQGLEDRKTPLFKKLEKPYVEREVTPSESSSSEQGEIEQDTKEKIEEEHLSSNEKDVIFSHNGQNGNGHRVSLTASTIESKNELRLLKIRTICLVIALMVHSLFEGLTVGLHDNASNVWILLALLMFHKSLVGFSLGIALVNDKSDLRSFQKKAGLFAIASPIGAIIGVIIFSAKSSFIGDEVVIILTGLSTGTFVYVTFFEILGKCLEGDKMEDMIGFGCFLLGFGMFAGITAVPQFQH